MLDEQAIHALNAMKLFGMARSFQERLDRPSSANLSNAEFFGLIVENERSYRDNRRLGRILKNTKLRMQACLEDIDYGHPRSLNRQTILDLMNTRWLDPARNVLITGPTGVGKSFIACGPGQLRRTQGIHGPLCPCPETF